MTEKQPNPFLGRWKITEMDVWDQEYVDLVAPGFIKFAKDNLGEFRFGTVRGFLDCRIEAYGDENRIEFSWDGENDSDPGHGRGWAAIRGGQLFGHLYIHMCDDSWFKAEKK